MFGAKDAGGLELPYLWLGDQDLLFWEYNELMDLSESQFLLSIGGSWIRKCAH